jgi:hypothetical protein
MTTEKRYQIIRRLLVRQIEERQKALDDAALALLLCACGCGSKVKPGAAYVKGHAK